MLLPAAADPAADMLAIPEEGRDGTADGGIIKLLNPPKVGLSGEPIMRASSPKRSEGSQFISSSISPSTRLVEAARAEEEATRCCCCCCCRTWDCASCIRVNKSRAEEEATRLLLLLLLLMAAACTADGEADGGGRR